MFSTIIKYTLVHAETPLKEINSPDIPDFGDDSCSTVYGDVSEPCFWSKTRRFSAISGYSEALLSSLTSAPLDQCRLLGLEAMNSARQSSSTFTPSVRRTVGRFGWYEHSQSMGRLQTVAFVVFLSHHGDTICNIP